MPSRLSEEKKTVLSLLRGFAEKQELWLESHKDFGNATAQKKAWTDLNKEFRRDFSKTEVKDIIQKCISKYNKYRNTIEQLEEQGKTTVPPNWFAFSFLDSFLSRNRENVVRQRDGTEVVLPFSTDKTSHIDSLVIGQKPSKGSKRPPGPVQLPSVKVQLMKSQTAQAIHEQEVKESPPSRGWERIQLAKEIPKSSTVSESPIDSVAHFPPVNMVEEIPESKSSDSAQFLPEEYPSLTPTVLKSCSPPKSIDAQSEPTESLVLEDAVVEIRKYDHESPPMPSEPCSNPNPWPSQVTTHPSYPPVSQPACQMMRQGKPQMSYPVPSGQVPPSHLVHRNNMFAYDLMAPNFFRAMVPPPMTYYPTQTSYFQTTYTRLPQKPPPGFSVPANNYYLPEKPHVSNTPYYMNQQQNSVSDIQHKEEPTEIHQNDYPEEEVPLPDEEPRNRPEGSSLGDDELHPVSERMKNNFRKILSIHPNGILCSKLPQLYLEVTGASLKHSDLGFPSIKEMALACQDVFKIHFSESSSRQNDWLLFDINNKCFSEDISKWVPRQVIENMQELTRCFPDGLCIDEILHVYQEKFGVSLDFKRLGFENLLSFLLSCPSIDYALSGDNGVIYPVNWGHKNFEYKEEFSSKCDITPDSIDILWKDKFPSDVCLPNFKFTPFEIPNGKFMEATVADCASPTLLWLQNVKTQDDLTELMKEMHEFYERHGYDYRINDYIVYQGMVCACIFDGQWHRAILVQSYEDGAKVLYVDYGTTSDVKLSDLRLLHKRFKDLPIQAVKAELYGITPRKQTWSAEAIDFLFENIHNRIFIAEIIVKNPEIPMVEVLLIDTSNDMNDLILNTLFIENKLANVKTGVDFSTLMNDQNATKKESPQNIESSRKQDTLPLPFMKMLPPLFGTLCDNWDSANCLLKSAEKNYLEQAKERDHNNDFYTVPCCYYHVYKQVLLNAPNNFCEAWWRTMDSKYIADMVYETFKRNFLLISGHPLPTLKQKMCGNENYEESCSSNSSKDCHSKSPSKVRQNFMLNGASDIRKERFFVDDKSTLSGLWQLKTVEPVYLLNKLINFLKIDHSEYILLKELIKLVFQGENENIALNKIIKCQHLKECMVIVGPKSYDNIHAELVLKGLVLDHEVVRLVKTDFVFDIIICLSSDDGTRKLAALVQDLISERARNLHA